MSKAIIPMVLIGGVGVTVVILMTRKAKAVIPSAEIPTVDDIMQSRSMPELNTYYNLIGELLIIGKLTPTEYMTLYNAYHERWYQLVGVS